MEKSKKKKIIKKDNWKHKKGKSKDKQETEKKLKVGKASNQ